MIFLTEAKQVISRVVLSGILALKTLWKYNLWQNETNEEIKEKNLAITSSLCAL